MTDAPESRNRRNRGGFTLAELIVVVAVVALLAGIAVPVFAHVRGRIAATRCKDHLRQLGVALNLYLGEHDMEFPALEPGRRSLDDDLPVIDGVLAEYVGDPAVFRCPSDTSGLWETTGTSYFWNSLLNGQRAGQLDFFGLGRSASGIPVMSDKENFHGAVGDELNVLYADGTVDWQVQFRVGGRR